MLVNLLRLINLILILIINSCSIKQLMNQIKESITMADWSANVNVRTISSNPIVKIINVIIGIIEFLIGKRRFGTLAEESDCIVINTTTKTLWFFTKSEDLTKISRNKISAVKVSTEKSWLFFRSTVCTIYASGVGEQVAYAVKCPYKEIKEKAESWLA